MKGLRHLRSFLVLAGVWVAASSGALLGSTAAALFAFVAVLILPGYQAGRVLGLPTASNSHGLELPARALTLSVAIVTLLGLACAALELPMGALLWLLFAASTALAVLPGPAAAGVAAPYPWSTRLALGALVAVTVLAMAMAAGAENIARDRMWYLAYVERLAAGAPLDWNEPFFGTGRVLARFAHNSWILSLAAWKGLCDTRGALVFQSLSPPLLTLCVASAALALARSLFGRGARAGVAALATLVVLLSTRYPFFSPDRYPLFGRLAEDKTVALLVFMPLATALAVDTLTMREGRARLAAGLVLALVATAFGHALVYLLLLAILAPFTLSLSVGTGARVSRRHAATVLAICAGLALPPGWLGTQARSEVLAGPASQAVLHDSAKDPVVRSHLRMERLLEIGAGGPVVNPKLLAEPVLVIALAGLALAALRRRTLWGAYLLCASLPLLAVAFTPWLSPLFGRMVLPWMAYRLLWAVPFGLLLGTVLVELPAMLAPKGIQRSGPAVVVAMIVLAATWNRMPWERLLPGDADARILSPDQETLELLDHIATLAPTARVAAATGLAELIPAYSGRYVLAFSDRGTVVFSGTRRSAERRLQGNAALIGLHGLSQRLRNRIVGIFDVTHSVYEGLPCDRKAVAVFRNGRFTLCAERIHAAGTIVIPRTSAAGGDQGRGRRVAWLGGQLRCRPQPLLSEDGRRHRWRREQRWSAKPVTADCHVRLDTPTRIAWLRLVLDLPRAHEAVVYRVAVTTGAGAVLRRHGVIEFRDNPNGEVRLPGFTATRIRIRLVPAYLPYLNVRALEIRD